MRLWASLLGIVLWAATAAAQPSSATPIYRQPDGFNWMPEGSMTGPIPFARLDPFAQNGVNGLWCPDCQACSTPCAGGGMGAFAYRENGQWDCSCSTNVNSITYQVCKTLWPTATAAGVGPVDYWAGTPTGMNLVSADCHCAKCTSATDVACTGSCAGTPATFTFNDQDGNAVSLTSSPLACKTGTSRMTFSQLFIGGNHTATSGKVIRYSVANSPSEVERVLLCVRFTLL